MLVGNLLHALDGGQVGLDGAVVAQRVGLLALAARGGAEGLGLARQVAAAQRRPGDEADARVVAVSGSSRAPPRGTAGCSGSAC